MSFLVLDLQSSLVWWHRPCQSLANPDHRLQKSPARGRQSWCSWRLCDCSGADAASGEDSKATMTQFHTPSLAAPRPFIPEGHANAHVIAVWMALEAFLSLLLLPSRCQSFSLLRVSPPPGPSAGGITFSCHVPVTRLLNCSNNHPPQPPIGDARRLVLRQWHILIFSCKFLKSPSQFPTQVTGK